MIARSFLSGKIFFACLTDLVFGRNERQIFLYGSGVGYAERLTRHAAAQGDSTVFVLDFIRKQSLHRSYIVYINYAVAVAVSNQVAR